MTFILEAELEDYPSHINYASLEIDPKCPFELYEHARIYMHYDYLIDIYDSDLYFFPDENLYGDSAERDTLQEERRNDAKKWDCGVYTATWRDGFVRQVKKLIKWDWYSAERTNRITLVTEVVGRAGWLHWSN